MKNMRKQQQHSHTNKDYTHSHTYTHRDKTSKHKIYQIEFSIKFPSIFTSRINYKKIGSKIKQKCSRYKLDTDKEKNIVNYI